jgi:pyrimidine deaminase RibD-like protein
MKNTYSAASNWPKKAWAQPTHPMVGSVIVYENRIIGEGWHRENRMPK